MAGGRPAFSLEDTAIAAREGRREVETHALNEFEEQRKARYRIENMSNPYQPPVAISAAKADVEKGRLIAEFHPGWFHKVFWSLASIFLLLITVPSFTFILLRATPLLVVYCVVGAVAFIAAGGFLGCANNVFQWIRLYESGIEFSQGRKKFFAWHEVSELVVHHGVTVRLVAGGFYNHHQWLYRFARQQFAEVLQELDLQVRFEKNWFGRT